MVSQFRFKLSQSLVSFLVVLGCVFGIGALQLPRLDYLKNQSKNTSPAVMQREVDREKVQLNLLSKIPAFGFDNLLADWVFLRFAQYFGDDLARETTGYQISPDYFDVILARDPRFLDSYIFLSSSTSLYAAQPEKSVALMNKGLKVLANPILPKSFYVWRYKATDELLFLGNAQAARESYLKSAEWADLYPNPESQTVARLSRETADFLSRNPQSKSAQINAWSMILSNPIDKRTKQNVIRRIEALGGKVTVTASGDTQIELPDKD